MRHVQFRVDLPAVLSAGLAGLSQGKSTQKCRQRRRKCIFPNLETDSSSKTSAQHVFGCIQTDPVCICSVLYSLRPALRATDHGPIGPINGGLPTRSRCNCNEVSSQTVHRTVFRALEPLKTAHRAVFRALDASEREAFGAVIQSIGSLSEGAGWHGSFAFSKAGLAFSQTANGSILGIGPWHRSQTEGVSQGQTEQLLQFYGISQAIALTKMSKTLDFIVSLLYNRLDGCNLSRTCPAG